ncbi:phosphatase PAP2 family protein [Rufibacter roseus]|uniref:Phosphatase PAP2 family protein n=1 Tax=Rufibacter roseus TaxID=1567108 RepID=A0ABW2DI65_9BACT|nr:phosphatase PAP2 family protein [Rufibacter roseus]
MNIKKLFAVHLLWLTVASKAFAQVVPADTVAVPLPDTPTSQKLEESHSTGRFVKRAVIPSVALIGLGLSTMKDNGFYSSYDASRDARRAFPNFNNNLDDYLFFVPIAGLYGFNLFSSQNRHDIRRQTGLVLASGLVTTALVYPTKILTAQERPNGLPRAFPSGHTAYAFTIATIVDKEFRDKSVWISVGSYTIATATGVMRVLNNEHWMSDVLAGAGVGILSVNTVYFIHNRLAKDKGLNTSLVPTVLPNGSLGMGMVVQF